LRTPREEAESARGERARGKKKGSSIQCLFYLGEGEELASGGKRGKERREEKVSPLLRKGDSRREKIVERFNQPTREWPPPTPQKEDIAREMEHTNRPRILTEESGTGFSRLGRVVCPASGKGEKTRDSHRCHIRKEEEVMGKKRVGGALSKLGCKRRGRRNDFDLVGVFQESGERGRATSRKGGCSCSPNPEKAFSISMEGNISEAMLDSQAAKKAISPKGDLKEMAAIILIFHGGRPFAERRVIRTAV